MKTALTCSPCGRHFTAERFAASSGFHRPVQLGARFVGCVELPHPSVALPLERAAELGQVLRAICSHCACRLLAEILPPSAKPAATGAAS